MVGPPQPALLLCLCLLALQRNAATATPPASRAPPRRPNILLFFPDELRYDWGGLSNNPYYTPEALPLVTPHFDAVAAAGTRFTRAFVGAPVCAPSRACLASGRRYDDATVPMNFHNDFNQNVETFYRVLRDDAGYHTMITGRDDLDKSSGGPGPDGTKHTDALGFSDSVRCDGSTDVTRGGVPHEPYGVWLKAQPVPNATVAREYNASDLFELKEARFSRLGRFDVDGNRYAIEDPQPLNGLIYQDDWIGEQALALLARRPRDRPFFLQVAHQAPHPPMDVTADMIASHNLRARAFPPPVLAQAGAGYSNRSMRVGRQNYAGKIERLDYWLGRYLAVLQDQGVRNSTVVCVASDHGEMLFDRGQTAKSKPWSSASSVPLFCSGPGIQADRALHYPVSTVDLAPTFLDLAGVLGRAPANIALGGHETSSPPPPVHFGLNNFRGIVVSRNDTCVLKFFCCAHVDGITGCPGSTPADAAGFAKNQSEFHLYNIAADRFELPSSDLRHRFPDLARELAAMLPPAHMTASNPNSSIPSQGYGYRWPGCSL